MNTNLGHLWELSKKLMIYFATDEYNVDPSIQEIFSKNGLSNPEWLNDGIVFSSIIMAYDDMIIEKLDNLHRLQQELLNEREIMNNTVINDTNDEEQIPFKLEDIEKEINQLDDEYSRLRERIGSIHKGNHNNADLFDEITSNSTIINNLRRKTQEAKDEFENCVNTLNEYNTEKKALLAELHKTTVDTKKFRSFLEEMNAFSEQISKHRAVLDQRQQQLLSIISKLESSKVENSKKLNRLEEELFDHKQLINSYHVLEDKIKKQEQQQENVLNQMINAVELAEEASAESQKQRLTRDMYNEELARIKSVIQSSEAKFGISVNEHEKVLATRYENAIGALKMRISQLMSDNQQVSYAKDSLEKQYKTAFQENSILRASKADNGFSSFIESISSIKAQIEGCYTKKEQLESEIELSTLNIEDMRTKSMNILDQSNSQQIQILKKKEIIEMELEAHKATLKSIIEKNTKFMAENQTIQSQISTIEVLGQSDIQREIKTRENEIRELNNKYQDIIKVNEEQINDIHQTILAVRSNADKWKLKAESIDSEAEDEHKKLDNEIEDIHQQIEVQVSILSSLQKDHTKYETVFEKLKQEGSNLKFNYEQKSKVLSESSMIIEKYKYQVPEMEEYIKSLKNLVEKLNMRIKEEQKKTCRKETYLEFSEFD